MVKSFLPPGFRFHPTDEELVVQYLKKKVAGKMVDNWVIGEIDIYKFEPTDLPGLAILCSKDPEWYFFNAQDKRPRTNRTTTAGYWKATGKDRRITVGSCSGMKKTLIYYLGRAPHGKRTDWVMHEYRLDEEVERKMNCTKSFVLCRVRKKSGVGPRNGEQYGAPVLEEDVEEFKEGIFVDDTSELSSRLCKSVMDEQVQYTSNSPIREIGDFRRAEDDFFDFVHKFLLCEDTDHEVQVVSNRLLEMSKDQNDSVLAEPIHTISTTSTDGNLSSMDNLSWLQFPANNEVLRLEDLVDGIDQEIIAPAEPFSDMPDHMLLHTEDIPSVGYLELVDLAEPSHGDFLELADLDEPSHEQSSSELVHYERLLSELDDREGFPECSSLAEDKLEWHLCLPHPCDKENMKCCQHFGDSVIGHKPEVSLPRFEGLITLGTDHRKLSTGDDEVGPSGSFSSSGNKGSALTHSPSNGSFGQPEGQLVGAYNSEDDTSSPYHLSLRTKSIDGELVESSANCRDSQCYTATPASPSSFAKVISGLLGKVTALPASAAELPIESRKCQSLEDKESVHTAPCIMAAAEVLAHSGSSTINGPLIYAETTSNPIHGKNSITAGEQLSMSSVSLLEGGQRKPYRSFTNCFSMVLFRITTLVLILFCMFRGFCRLTRVALA
ncbi:hypothetical protein KP509_38G020200 [Ceratopteris richardii]|uniref:NAC domain-containing protein n=2 Tax=Ceratopteris richardii TaxID=49495 RepID=A0A8T2Q2R8_CERRI|nr:hypothetical protein KP509_38G020200 [Ceratopteris richardii]